MSSRPPNGMVKSSIENSGLLITRTLHRHKHQLRDFFNTHACYQQLSPNSKGLGRSLSRYCSFKHSALACLRIGMSRRDCDLRRCRQTQERCFVMLPAKTVPGVALMNLISLPLTITKLKVSPTSENNATPVQSEFTV